MTAAMQLQEGCRRLAGVVPLLAAGLRLSLEGFSLRHKAPAAWDTRCWHYVDFRRICWAFRMPSGVDCCAWLWLILPTRQDSKVQMHSVW